MFKVLTVNDSALCNLFKETIQLTAINKYREMEMKLNTTKTTNMKQAFKTKNKNKRAGEMNLFEIIKRVKVIDIS